MLKVKLLTSDGSFVTEVDIPPFQVMPDGLQWGARTFFRNAAGEYREGLLFHVTVVE
jgi:hypothetical protein